MNQDNALLNHISFDGDSDSTDFKSQVLQDYWICLVSREVSLLARREVLSGKAKFGILGDGKEVPQVAMARYFKDGDHRSGYYRDQTLMFALGLCSVQDFFAQLYADNRNDPFSGGRQMNSHFATPYIDDNGDWLEQKNLKNISSDISCTAGQMARALGIALASKKYRQSKSIGENSFSVNGNEICFCTIGDASTSEGVFWETMNAAAVSQVPLVVSVWDDGYGISVPKELQTVKNSISDALLGFRKTEDRDGIIIEKVNGGDYVALCEAYEKVCHTVRKQHIPALIHVEDLTQPQGHSTSGSHERYKSKDRLTWEKENDCNVVFGNWIVQNGLLTLDEAEELKKKAKKFAREEKIKAWKAYSEQVTEFSDKLLVAMEALPADKFDFVNQAKSEVTQMLSPTKSEVIAVARRLAIKCDVYGVPESEAIIDLAQEMNLDGLDEYSNHLHSATDRSALKVPVVHPEYGEAPTEKNGYEILNSYFEIIFEKYDNLYAFGEDVGQIGDVNQGFAGLQNVFGDDRIFDAGIREWSIIGQALGMNMRGLKTIAEIQYLDYMIYALPILSDDLATLRYRSNGIQHAPAIIRTRGHRLEGIWHAGSPMGMLLNSLKGIYLCVPRNMVQAAGMYNTLLQSDDPAVVIECLNGYRLKENEPVNLAQATVPLGVPDMISEGDDVTLVTYGSCVRVAQTAVAELLEIGISVELIDVQTLMPFDLEQSIRASLSKTNKLVVLDEDVPGGGTAYMMHQILEIQGAFELLDAAPISISAAKHRTPFGTDGDYFAKPNPEDVVAKIYTLMKAYDPGRF